MELAYWYLSLALLVALIVAAVVLRWRKISLSKWLQRRQFKPIANTRRLAKLPAYQQKVRRLAMVMTTVFVMSGIGLLASLALVGRYSSVETERPETYNRDIVLCLDISGSMYEVDGQIATIFRDLVTQFKGQRISTVLFDSSSVVYFPLVNDYGFAADQLGTLSEALTAEVASDSSIAFNYVWSGTTQGSGSSLVGDGLTSCIMRFGKEEAGRARSIILATDNYIAGPQIVTLAQATNLAKQRGIRVYGINPYDYTNYDGTKTPEAQEMHDLLLDTGGDYYKVDAANVIDTIINKVNEQEATRFKGTPVIAIYDKPQFFIALCLAAVLLNILVAWRYRL